MKITILTIGSRGDVQPYVALGQGLQQVGFTVRVATHAAFEDFVIQNGLDFAPVGDNPFAMLNSSAGRNWLDSNNNPVQFIRYFVELTRPRLEQVLNDSWQACQGAEAIVYGILGNVGFHIAEKLGVPGIMANLQPFTPTRAFRSLGVPSNWPQMGGVSNWISHKVTEHLLWQPFRNSVNQWRQTMLGLRPLPVSGPYQYLAQPHAPILYGFSPRVVAPPTDWPADSHVTGYWFLNLAEDYQPPAKLVDFLAAGPRPLHIGFGSMTDAQPQVLLDILLKALQNSGQRAVILSGWAGLHAADLPETVLALDAVPHDWLFPQVTAVVHHGGAGTTAAGLRAGVPSILIPYFADQHFWSDRVKNLGVGPTPVPRRDLSVIQLTKAINEAVHNQSLRQRAAMLGAHIRDEDGVATAVALIQKTVGNGIS